MRLATVSKHSHALAAGLERELVSGGDLVGRRALRQVYGLADGGVGVALKCRLNPNMPVRRDLVCGGEEGPQVAGYDAVIEPAGPANVREHLLGGRQTTFERPEDRRMHLHR